MGDCAGTVIIHVMVRRERRACASGLRVVVGSRGKNKKAESQN